MIWSSRVASSSGVFGTSTALAFTGSLVEVASPWVEGELPAIQTLLEDAGESNVTPLWFTAFEAGASTGLGPEAIAAISDDASSIDATRC